MLVPPTIEYEIPTDGTKDRETRYVEVKVAPKTMNTILPANFLGGPTSARAGAVAIAGFKSVVCKVMPMFICNPFEGTSVDILTPAGVAAAQGRQIKMQMGPGPNADYEPGNFGWLQSGNGDLSSGGPNGNVPLIKKLLAGLSPPVCFEQTGVVTTQTGQIESMNNAINVRFGIYRSSFQNAKDNPEYPPDVNVRKGLANADCDKQNAEVNPNYRMGRDQTWPNDGTTSVGRLGNGDWLFDQYWTNNYGPNIPAPNNWSNASPPTRYEVYQFELSTPNATISTDLVAYNNTTIGETGTPACNASSRISRRRILYAAIINCDNLNFQGHTANLPVLAFGKFFMTEPIPRNVQGETDPGTLFTEFIDIVNPASTNNEIRRDIVQLYR
jgi:hypothetical protein